VHVEECCQDLLVFIIPQVDPKHEGACYDIGVGTFAFYCEVFARLGFKTIAVEPLPVRALRNICKTHGITLLEECLSDKNGVQTLYIGSYDHARNLNLSSLVPDWWGASTEEKTVRTVRLDTLISNTHPQKITCMKLDIEGMEPKVMEQLPDIPPELLPGVIMFEYGGGGIHASGEGGWSDKFIRPTVLSLEILKQLGYGLTIIIDGANETKENIFDLQEQLPADNLFDARAVYGNIISIRGDRLISKNDIINICSLYRDNNSLPHSLNPVSVSIWRKLYDIVRSLVK